MPDAPGKRDIHQRMQAGEREAHRDPSECEWSDDEACPKATEERAVPVGPQQPRQVVASGAERHHGDVDPSIAGPRRDGEQRGDDPKRGRDEQAEIARRIENPPRWRRGQRTRGIAFGRRRSDSARPSCSRLARRHRPPA